LETGRVFLVRMDIYGIPIKVIELTEGIWVTQNMSEYHFKDVWDLYETVGESGTQWSDPDSDFVTKTFSSPGSAPSQEEVDQIYEEYFRYLLDIGKVEEGKTIDIAFCYSRFELV
jgi:hypothetical protein